MFIGELSIYLISDEITQIIKTHSYLKEIKKGDFVFRQGEEHMGLYVVEKGVVGLIKISENGNESLLRVFGEEYIFGHRSLVTKENYHASAVALKNSKIRVIPKPTLDKLFESYPEFILFIAKVLGIELRFSENRFKNATGHNVKERVIESIIFLKNRYPNHVWTRKEIGEYSLATAETVTRILSQLEKLGIIAKDKRDFTILDEQKMLAASDKIFI